MTEVKNGSFDACSSSSSSSSSKSLSWNYDNAKDEIISWLPPPANTSSAIVEVERTSDEKEARLRWGEHNINAGCLRELPMIAIDKFHGETLQANIFFLTHLHTDHMVGLEFLPFLKRIEEPDVKLYTSSATPLLFPIFANSGYLGGPENMQHLIREEKVVPVDVNQKFELDYVTKDGREHKKVVVTMIPAGHCPGSVMLVFEYDAERILYTGDFRLSTNEIMNLKSCYYNSEKEYLKDYPNHRFSDSKSKLKRISHLYLDTTFCSNKNLRSGSISPSSSSFVSRDNAIQHILPRIKDHLKHKDHIIQLEFSARVSHEYAIVQFNKLLNQKTHVSREVHNIYSEIDSCVSSMTLDSSAVIHLCKKDDNCMSGKKILKIKFSTMWYTMGNGNSTTRERGNFVNVCYSMHASMKEMGTLISAFDTKVVTPLVQPRDLPRSQIEEVLRSITKHKFEYKDYENEPIYWDCGKQYKDVGNVTKRKSPTKFNFSSSPTRKSNSFNQHFQSEFIEPSKKAKMLSWSRDKTPPPSKL